ncbi:MAG: hypothetical protein QXO02_10365 [Thermofilaceae archaeon]
MPATRYVSFEQVWRSCRSGVFRNESELRQAFVEALKEELRRASCHRYIAENWLIPALEDALRSGRADIRVSNLVVEVEPPGAGLAVGVEQLKRYMNDVFREFLGLVDVFGLVTDGLSAEFYVLQTGGEFELKSRGDMPGVARGAVAAFCSQQKIPIVRVEDLVRLFGV